MRRRSGGESRHVSNTQFNTFLLNQTIKRHPMTWQALSIRLMYSACHVIDTYFRPSFLESDGIL